jgi:hypothetical protein
MVTYGYTVRWRSSGSEVSVSVNGCETLSNAVVKSFEAAKRLGYERPSWWQVVRWLNEPDYERRYLETKEAK